MYTLLENLLPIKYIRTFVLFWCQLYAIMALEVTSEELRSATLTYVCNPCYIIVITIMFATYELNHEWLCAPKNIVPAALTEVKGKSCVNFYVCFLICGPFNLFRLWKIRDIQNICALILANCHRGSWKLVCRETVQQVARPSLPRLRSR